MTGGCIYGTIPAEGEIMRVISRPAAGDMIRRLLLAWLLTGAIQYTCLPASKRVLSGFSALTGQSFPLLLVGTAVCFVLLTLAGLLWRTARWERAALPLCFGWQLVLGCAPRGPCRCCAPGLSCWPFCSSTPPMARGWTERA